MKEKKLCWQRGILVNGVILRLFRLDKTNMKQTLHDEDGVAFYMCAVLRSECALFALVFLYIISFLFPLFCHILYPFSHVAIARFAVPFE